MAIFKIGCILEVADNGLILNRLVHNAAMKSNNKVAPVSCHCKLSALIPHLKNLSVRLAGGSEKGKVLAHPASTELLLKRHG
jgi:hypothetical protein